jgi:hypothetical protein
LLASALVARMTELSGGKRVLATLQKAWEAEGEVFCKYWETSAQSSKVKVCRHFYNLSLF